MIPAEVAAELPRPTTAMHGRKAAAGAGVVPHSLFLALSRLRRRKFDSTISLCDQLLKEQALDRAAWIVKLQALTGKRYIDLDLELEEEGVADIIMDQHAMNKMPRPGTSLRPPPTSSGRSLNLAGGSSGGISQSVRPLTQSGRPLSGFARPGTQSGRGGGGSGRVEDAFKGVRPGTSRPMSMAGRYVRLGTASMLADGSDALNIERIDVHKYAHRHAEAKTLIDYLLYHDHNPKKALELAASCTQAVDFKDWWYKARLGKCYYELGMFRDAESQFQSSLRNQEMISTYLELAKVYLRLDQPSTALDIFMKASEKYPGDTHLICGVARVHDAVQAADAASKSVAYYKKVLHYDASNAEALACLASHHFYTDQPEIALRFYRRLLQMGVSNTELWNNVGLCCFYASQYDMSLGCFDRALALADDNNMADVWYNVGQVAIGIGDLNLAYQAFKIAISVDAGHAESWNNLGILELRKGQIDQARAHFQTAQKLAHHMFEAFFNGALLAFKLGDCSEAYELAAKALEAFPEHTDSKELLKQLKKHFTML